MKLQELMLKINKSPESFLQADCIYQLRAFLRGFIFSKNIAIQGLSEDHKTLEEFDLYLKSIYNINSSEKGVIEEFLYEVEGEEAFSKYLEHWLNYAKK